LGDRRILNYIVAENANMKELKLETRRKLLNMRKMHV